MNQALPRSIMIDEMSTQQSVQPDDAGFGLEDLLSVIYSQRLFMLAIVIVTLLGGLAYLYLKPPSYFAVAQVAIGAGQGDDVSKTTGVAQTMPPDSTLVESEIQILSSNDQMDRLINKLGPQNVAQGLQMAEPASYANAATGTAKRRDLIQALQARLVVKRQQTSTVIALGFAAPTPEEAVRLANTMVEAYLDSKIQERYDAAERNESWLQSRVQNLAKDVEDKEKSVAAYRANMKLLSVDGSTITEQQYFKLQGEVVTARADLTDKQARLSQVEKIAASGGTGDSVLQALNSPSIQALRSKEAEIAGREAELSTRYFDNHPAMQQVHKEHEEVRQQITAEIGRIKTSQANEVDVSRRRLDEMEKGLKDLEGGLVEGNRAIVGLQQLERDAEVSSSLYRDFLTRARAIADQEMLKVVDARSVSRAIAPQQTATASKAVWAAFFLAAGVFLALLAAIVRTALNDRIIRSESIWRRFGVPALVSVPLIHRRQMRKLPPDERTPEDYLVSRPMTAFAESLRVLGANLMSEFDGSGLAVAVTSAVAAEGKTTISLSLGRAAAMSGLKVLIVDCDVRRPSLSASVADASGISLVDVIQNGVDWRSAAVPDVLTEATVLPINAAGKELQTLFRPDAVRKVLTDVRPHFDLIVLDCPPVLAIAETRWIASVADATIVVTQWNRTRGGAVKAALREVARAKGRLAGVVLNRVDIAVARRFSFGDSLYYGNAGKGYYSS